MPSPQQVLESLPAKEPVAGAGSEVSWPAASSGNGPAGAGTSGPGFHPWRIGSAGKHAALRLQSVPRRHVVAGIVVLFFLLGIGILFIMGVPGGLGAAQNTSAGTSHNGGERIAPVAGGRDGSSTPEIPVVITSAPVPAGTSAVIVQEPVVTNPPVTPVSYVTIEPVPTDPVPVIQDIRSDLPVPAYSGFFTIFSMTNQKMPQKLPYVSYTLNNPPLIVEYTVTPMNVSEVKDINYKILTKVYHETLTINREYEQASFTVIVRDRDTGQIVAKDGYGKTDTLVQKKQLVLYKGGNYRFEFSGAYTTVDLTLKVPREGNIR